MKKENLNYSDLIAAIKTVQDADQMISDINTLKILFAIPSATTSIGTTSAKIIAEIISKNNIDVKDREIYLAFLKNLIALIRKLKIIKLVLAFDPTQKTINKIHKFISDKIGIGYILETEVSEGILGGAIIIINGKHNDFTLKKTIENTFETKKEDLFSIK